MGNTQTIGGVCAGVGGLEMAAALALGPVEAAWHAEFDPDASAVLAARWPGVPNHGDITTIDWRKVEPVDVYCAGFPCQTVSAAGKQLGDDDDRWLWERPATRATTTAPAHAPTGRPRPADPAAEMVGVIVGIRTLRPATVVIENVANLVSYQGGRLFRAVLDDLRDAGYMVRWAIAGACMVGGAHHRHRVFILARRVGGTPPPASRVAMPTCVNSATQLLPTPRARDWKRGGTDSLEDALLSVPLLPTPTAADSERGPDYARMARKGSGGDDLVAAVARLKLLPTPRASDGTKGGPNMRGSSGDLMLPSAVQPQRWGQYAAAVARWAGLFGSLPPEPTEPTSTGGLRLAAPFSEWLMGYPEGWVTGLRDRKAGMRLIGNGVMPQQGGGILRALAADEEAPADLFGALVGA